MWGVFREFLRFCAREKKWWLLPLVILLLLLAVILIIATSSGIGWTIYGIWPAHAWESVHS
jgi:hypothetical protein